MCYAGYASRPDHYTNASFTFKLNRGNMILYMVSHNIVPTYFFAFWVFGRILLIQSAKV